MVKNIVTSIPNAITCCNLLSGVLACIVALIDPIGTVMWGLSGFELAWLLIAAAAAFDFFDGFSARLLHAYSPLGKELDSLADLVSFGLAPGILMFNLLRCLCAPGWLIALTLMIPVCGALRLARFNIDDRQATSFIGLPIPSNAIFWIGYSAWLMQSVTFPISATYLWLTAVLVPGVALMMVSGIPMFSLKFSNVALRDNTLRYLQVAGTALLLIIFHVPGAALAIVLYAFLSVIDNLSRNK